MKNGEEKTYYELLEINQDATQQEINKAWKIQARLFHPDRYTGPPEHFLTLKKASKVLLSQDKRRAYDEKLNQLARKRKQTQQLSAQRRAQYENLQVKERAAKRQKHAQQKREQQIRARQKLAQQLRQNRQAKFEQQTTSLDSSSQDELILLVKWRASKGTYTHQTLYRMFSSFAPLSGFLARKRTALLRYDEHTHPGITEKVLAMSKQLGQANNKLSIKKVQDTSQIDADALQKLYSSSSSSSSSTTTTLGQAQEQFIHPQTGKKFGIKLGETHQHYEQRVLHLLSTKQFQMNKK